MVKVPGAFLFNLTIYLFLHISPILADTGSGKTPHRVPRVSSAVKIDAVLDESVWRDALMLEMKYEVLPGENILPPVRTEVFLAYDENNLYVAFRAYDPEPSKIRAHISDRDKIFSDDWLVLILDTFNDERRTFDFFSNPLGVQADQIESPGGENMEWDAIFESNGRITDEGYITEMAIPFSSLRFQRSDTDQVWGIDAVRSYPRNVRHHIGLFPRDRNNNCYMCQSEKLIGFAGAAPGKNIELDPTFTSLYTEERENFPYGSMAKKDDDYAPGLSAAWGFTPNLTLNAAVNPDFSQVEADAPQLDINKTFALYYSEKRPFFTENPDLFSTRLNAIYTRTLADPDWGVKISGKEKEYAVGFFTVRDNITNLVFPGSEGSSDTSLKINTQGTVLRLRRDISHSSTLGLLVTDREGNDYYNRLGGIDGDIRFTSKDQLRFQLLGSRTGYPDEIATRFDQSDDAVGGTALDITYNHSARNLDWYAMYREVTDDFRADLGFMPQTDYRYCEVGWGYTWHHDPGHWYTMLNFGSGYERKETREGDYIFKGLRCWFDYTGPLQSYLDIYGSLGGKYAYAGKEFNDSYFNLDIGFRPHGMFAFELDSYYGHSIDLVNVRASTRLNVSPEIELILGRHLTVEYAHTYERMTVDEGQLYTAHTSQLKTVYQFNKRVFLRLITQYRDYKFATSLYPDDWPSHEKKLFTQFLFSYKINPQTVLYIGYSDNYFGDQDIDLTQTNRTFFTKIGYAWVL